MSVFSAGVVQSGCAAAAARTRSIHVAKYRASAADPRKDSYLIWRYTADHAAGTIPPLPFGTARLGGRSQGRR